MDDRLQIIRHLYGEEVEDPTFTRRLSEDAALRREYEHLRTTKERLDRRPLPQPDPAVVDRVVDAARDAAQNSSAASPANDRPARPPIRTWNRRLQAVSAGLALLLAIGLGWWQQRPEASGGDSFRASAESAPPQTQAASPQDQPRGTDTVPAWDDSDELVRIHRRVQRLQARSATDAWGEVQTVNRKRP